MARDDDRDFFPLDDSERSYGYSSDIYHGNVGTGGHYGRRHGANEGSRFYPGRLHHETSYEYGGEHGFPGSYPRDVYGPEESFMHTFVPPGGRHGGDAGPYAGRGPRGYRRSDQRIHEEVCDRLAAHGHIDASEVEVTVEGGEVTLEGQVRDRRTKRLAEAAVDHVVGVVDVHNRLRIGGREAGGARGEAAADEANSAQRTS